MAQLFNMPQLGSTMEEGLVALWRRREGEAIQKGDILLEVETDKTIVEVQAPCDGVLRKILAEPETRVPVHQPIAILGLEYEDITPLLAALSAESANHETTQEAAGEQETALEIAGEQPTATIADIGAGNAAFAISPRARRLAEERSVALNLLAGRGTGPGGRVIERDVLAFLEGGEQIGDLNELALGLPGSRIRPMTVSPRPAPERSSPHSPAHSVPVQARHLPPPVGAAASMALEVDMTACFDLHAQLLPAVLQTYHAALDCIHLVVKATAGALATVPQLNATLTDEGLQVPAQIDIAVCTLVANALVTQVVERAETRSLGAVCAALAGETDNDHRPQGATAAQEQRGFMLYVLTHEVDRFYPSLLPGHVAALGIGRIAPRPAVSNGQIVARLTQHLCLTYDPARVDTALAARFLQRLKELLEAPAQILI